jgi:tetratricopeptide (TPR) repeat protein
LLLVVVTLITYLPVRHHSFVFYDDSDYITGNRMAQAGLTWAGVKWAFTTGHSSNWHPLTWLSHMLDAQLFGTGPTGPHVVNVLFHVTNTVLLFIVLRRLTGALWRSALVAALFALHPLHVESVAWVAERKDVLSAFFFLLTLWAYTKYAEPSPVRNPNSKAWYGCALLLFALGLMSKPMLVTLPFVLLLLDYWPLRRMPEVRGQVRGTKSEVRWKKSITHHGSRVTLRSLAWEKVPFLLLSALSCVVTFVAQRKGGAVRSLASFSMSERIENALVSYARYLGKTFWPADLTIFYPHPGHWPAGQVVIAAILVAGLCLGIVWFGRRVPFAATGWFWFCGMMLPVIGLIQAGGQSMADRYTYLPLIGVFIILAWGAGEAFMRWRVPKAAIGIAAGLVVVACAVQTGGQLRYWRNSESLFRHAIAVTKENFVAHNNLGNILLDKGQVDKAITHYQKALEIRPGYADAHNNLGNALLQKGRVDEAIAHLQKALEILPDDALAHVNFGNALLQKGQADRAITHYQKALEIRPDDAGAHNNLGTALLQKGRVDDAITHFQKALEIQPDYANAHYNLGNALLRKGQMDEAITHLKKALEIRPDDADTHNDLGFVLLRKGHVHEAMAHYQTALKLQPDNARTLSNLAWVLATWPEASIRNGAKAIELAQRANELSDGRDGLVLLKLAAAYAEGGQFAEAVTAAQRALQLADAQSNAALADMLRSQLKLYQAGSPFRDTGQADEATNVHRP